MTPPMPAKARPFARNRLIRDAIGQALYDGMKLDASIYLFGEGAHMKVHFDAPQIEQEFSKRVITLPISEDGNLNFCVGASFLGIKPVCDVITADFLFRAFDAIANTCAKLNFVAPEGEPPKTIVIRSEFLTGGPTTGQRPEMLFARIPGLNVVVPSTPRDAYGLMLMALTSPGVTLFFEDRMIPDSQICTVEKMSTFPEERVPIPFGHARHCTTPEAAVLTVVAYGLMRELVEGVIWEQDFLDEVELLDLRTLSPLDWETIERSLSTTRQLLVVEPDVCFGGIGAEIAAVVAEKLPGTLVRRLGAPRETIPASREGQARMLPSHAQIVESIRGLVSV